MGLGVILLLPPCLLSKYQCTNKLNHKNNFSIPFSAIATLVLKGLEAQGVIVVGLDGLEEGGDDDVELLDGVVPSVLIIHHWITSLNYMYLSLGWL